MKQCRAILALMLVIVFFSGCAHPLTLENMGCYKPTFVNSEFTNYSIGVTPSTNSAEEERLVIAVANSMKKDGFRVFYPFYPNEGNKQSVSYIIKIATSAEYKGSGVNFWINWPGFLIWAPALFGYVYNVKYDFDIDITDTKNNYQIPRLSLPIQLKVRHAELNRTWTEISWLEVSAIAFVGGLFFMSYDKSVTPILLDSSENKIGEYVSSKIGSTLSSLQSTAAQTTLETIPNGTLPPATPAAPVVPPPQGSFKPMKDERK